MNIINWIKKQMRGWKYRKMGATCGDCQCHLGYEARLCRKKGIKTTVYNPACNDFELWAEDAPDACLECGEYDINFGTCNGVRCADGYETEVTHEQSDHQ